MNQFTILILLTILLACSQQPEDSTKLPDDSMNYQSNRPPLRMNPFIELPIGTIKPEGWLEEQLVRMAEGMTGHLDEQYDLVLGDRNGWLGGDGDGWERGPYWLDGLLPLAYLIEDQKLIDKVKPWIEWSLNNQRDDGYFGPVPFKTAPDPEPGIQKDRRKDWWPKMVMLKVLKQHYSATRDERVIKLFANYFKYQLDQLESTPLDTWSFWANRRGGDNLMMVYWLYNITGDDFLLQLAETIHEQTFPWAHVFLNEDCKKQDGHEHLYPYNTGNRYPFNEELINRLCTEQLQSFHCVNIAQGIKEPVVYYQQHPDDRYLHAVRKAFADIEKYHGQPQGMYGGDEPMHGNDPTKGIEFCSIVEMMFSLENIVQITGETSFADHLEKIAYNALPTQATDDFTSRQYFQSANQVLITRDRHNFYQDDSHGGTDLCYGLLTGYACCTCNMHQGWPKYTQNLWYATPDNGLAALFYAPNRVSARVANGKEVIIREETFYPFDENIRFSISTPEDLEFPLYFRIPGWCKEGWVKVNDEPLESYQGGQIISLLRTWTNGDLIELHLPMHVFTTRWFENSAAVQRGPLVFALKIEEEWKWVENNDTYGNYYEVFPKSNWNYGLLYQNILEPEEGFQVIIKERADYPWNIDHAPVELITMAKIIPDWKMYNAVPGPIPHSGPQQHVRDDDPHKISLIPYGCTTLRITEFPLVE
jgi:DUF1680 family protein